MKDNKLYKIKPLVWVKHETHPIWYSLNGSLPFEIEKAWNHNQFVLYGNARAVSNHETLEAAQAAAAEFNKQHLLPWLEEATQ